MNFKQFVRTIKKLSNINLHTKFKITFCLMVTLFALNIICFTKNIASHQYLTGIFNFVTLSVIGYHSFLILYAIKKKNYQKKLLVRVCIDFSSLVAYVLCPLYVIVAFMNNQMDFILPVGLCALIIHFFALPTIRSWKD